MIGTRALAPLALAAIAAGATLAVAQNVPTTTHTIVKPDTLNWGPGPAGLPKGLTAAILSGDPGKSEPFTLRARMPDGYVVPPHWHSQAETVTVLSGQLHIGMGDKLDKAKAEALGPGGFFALQPRMQHYVFASGETVIQVTSMGPFDSNYLDPKDDPRQNTTGAR
jgi:uncharacterized RmlC-like cupin family protein